MFIHLNTRELQRERKNERVRGIEVETCRVSLTFYASQPFNCCKNSITYRNRQNQMLVQFTHSLQCSHILLCLYASSVVITVMLQRTMRIIHGHLLNRLPTATGTATEKMR